MTKPIRVLRTKSNGLLHIGNARTKIVQLSFARHHGGTFLIRIEDTDRKRHVEDGERSHLKTCVGWALTGMKAQKPMSNTVNQSV